MNSFKAARRPQRERVPSVREARMLFSSRRRALMEGAETFGAEFSRRQSALFASSVKIGATIGMFANQEQTKIPSPTELAKNPDWPSLRNSRELDTLIFSSAALSARIESAPLISPKERESCLAEIAKLTGYQLMFLSEGAKKKDEIAVNCQYLNSLPMEAAAPRFIQNPLGIPLWLLSPAGIFVAVGHFVNNLPKADLLTMGLIGACVGAVSLWAKSTRSFWRGRDKLMNELEKVSFNLGMFESMKEDALAFLGKLGVVQKNLAATLEKLQESQR